MAISLPGVGAAAGSVGQLLMQEALRGRERDEREAERAATQKYRDERLDLQRQRLAASMAPEPVAPPTFPATARTPTGTIRGEFPTAGEAAAFVGQHGVAAPPKPPKPRDLSPTGAQLRGAAERDVGMMLTEGEFDIEDPAHRQVISKSLQQKYPKLRGEVPGMVSERVGEGAEESEQRARLLEAVRAVAGVDSRYEAERVLEPYGYRDKVSLFADARRLGIPQSELGLQQQLSGPYAEPSATAPEPPAAPPTPTEAPSTDEVARARASVQSARAQGKDDASIREALRSAGFTDAEVAQIMGG